MGNESVSLLLDTHVWIWSQEAPEKLGPIVRRRLLSPTETLSVSTISTLEIARLIDGGLLVLSGDLMAWAKQSLEFLQARTIDLSHDIAIGAYTLPSGFHKDPADRILVATAKLLSLELVTADERILAYPHVRCVDARL